MTTKKTFQAFADAIAQLESGVDKERMAEVCIRVFEADNPAFDRGRFLRACGFVPFVKAVNHKDKP